MTNNNSSTSIAPRCQFQFSDDRCCLELRSPAHASYCGSTPLLDSDSSRECPPGITEPDAPEEE